MLYVLVMSALRGDQARTARCLRRGSAARRDPRCDGQELPPARVCRAPISGTIAHPGLLHLQICTISGERFGSPSQISDCKVL